jgi:anti-sigma factor RsiW
MLMAYVDGELDAAETAALAEVIRQDPRAREMVARFRESAAAVRTAYDRPLSEPVPERLLRAAAAPAPRRAAPWVARRILPVALAAGLAGLAVGLGAGHLAFAPAGPGALRTAAAPPDGPGAAHEAALFQALESGVTVPFEDPATGVRGEVVPGEALATRHAGSCREYEVLTAGAGGPERLAGIACVAGGGWAVMDLPAAEGP